MSIKKDGVRIGELYGFADGPVIAALEFNERGCLVKFRQKITAREVREALDGDHNEIPDEMVFKDSFGTLWLASSRIVRTRFNVPERTERNIQVDRVVERCFSGSSFSSVFGMKTVVNGLYRWADVKSPIFFIDCFDADGQAVDVRAKNIPSIDLRGPMGGKLSTSIVPHQERWTGRVGLDYRIYFQTSSDSLQSWNDHAQVHGMMQDVMCLVYGKPCGVDIVQVSDDEGSSGRGNAAMVRRRWAEVYEPGFGRAVQHVDGLDPEKDSPLFVRSDMNSSLFSEFINSWQQSWSRPLRIATTTLFQSEATVEAKLIQVAVALESLGYTIKTNKGQELKSVPGFESLVNEVVNDFISKDEDDRKSRREFLGKIFRGPSHSDRGVDPSKWVKKFKEAYLGAKHADRNLSDPYDSHALSEQGMKLIRVWFGKRVGVDIRLMAGNLDFRVDGGLRKTPFHSPAD